MNNVSFVIQPDKSVGYTKDRKQQERNSGRVKCETVCCITFQQGQYRPLKAAARAVNACKIFKRAGQ